MAATATDVVLDIPAPDFRLPATDGKTYALTNQWSRASMEAVLDALKGQFGDYGFALTRTD